MQSFSKEKNMQLHYMGGNNFVLSVNTNDISKNVKNLDDLFQFSNLSENHELFSYSNKKVIGKNETETPKFIWIDEIICLRTQKIAFKCVFLNINRKVLASLNRKLSNFRPFKKCSDESDYQNNVIIILFVQIFMKCIFKNSKI